MEESVCALFFYLEGFSQCFAVKIMKCVFKKFKVLELIYEGLLVINGGGVG